jgi:hypothetical protein
MDITDSGSSQFSEVKVLKPRLFSAVTPVTIKG